MSRTHIFVVGLLLMIALCGVASAAIVSPLIDHGNGVLSFYNSNAVTPSFGDSYQNFGDALSQYLSEHPEKHVVSAIVDTGTSYGSTQKFYIIVENKTIPSFKCNPVYDGKAIGTTAIVSYNCEASP